MFVVQVRGKFSKKNLEVYLKANGRRTDYYNEAQIYRTEEEGAIAGKAFVDAGKAWSYTVDPA